MSGDIVDIEDERSDREDTDPQVKLDRLQVRHHGERLGLLEQRFDAMMGLLRSIAKKVGASEE